MDLSKSNIDFVDTKIKFDEKLQKLNAINQKLIFHENKKNQVSNKYFKNFLLI